MRVQSDGGRRLSRRRGLALAGAGLGFGGLSASGCIAVTRTPLAGKGAQPELNGGVLSQPVLLPEFALSRADGRPFSSAETRGRWSLFFFGYTTCPDVCPLTLAYVSQVRRQLAGRAPDAYFVTVDPARDTPARLAEYMRNFDAGIVALSGSDEALARALAAFGAVAQRREVPGSAAGYLMDHTALIYLVDPQSQITLVYPHGMQPADIVADLNKLLSR
jgi:protein SCO1/2